METGGDDEKGVVFGAALFFGAVFFLLILTGIACAFKGLSPPPPPPPHLPPPHLPPRIISPPPLPPPSHRYHHLCHCLECAATRADAVANGPNVCLLSERRAAATAAAAFSAAADYALAGSDRGTRRSKEDCTDRLCPPGQRRAHVSPGGGRDGGGGGQGDCCAVSSNGVCVRGHTGGSGACITAAPQEIFFEGMGGAYPNEITAAVTGGGGGGTGGGNGRGAGATGYIGIGGQTGRRSGAPPGPAEALAWSAGAGDRLPRRSER